MGFRERVELRRLLASDLVRAGYLVGTGMMAIGALRNRKWEQEAKTAERGGP